MPIHIVECYDCGYRQEKYAQPDNPLLECEKCKGKARIVYDWGKMGIDIFQPFIDTNMTDKPIRIESKQQWARECKKHGVVSHALNSGYRTY